MNRNLDSKLIAAHTKTNVLFAGFHEAVGEAVALSIASPRHLQDLGLIQSSVDDVPHNINSLFSLALDKLPFLAFSLVMDQWRWDIFDGTITSEQYNCHWWRLR